MELVLGVDSGGTKTLAALAGRDGRVVRLRRSGSLDPVAVPGWAAELAALVGDLGTGQVAAAVLGLPYHGEIAAISAEQARVASDLMAGRAEVDNDVRIAFDGAFAGGGGALILAGTGSMAWASLAEPGAPHVRAGGWGDLFGDEGSAYWIGREALADVARELDGRLGDTGFAGALLGAVGITADGLLDWAYGQDQRRAAIADLARHVAALAETGNPRAIALLRRAGDELAATLTAAWARAAGPLPLRWSHAGGVMANSIVRTRIAEVVGVPPLPCRLPPVGGALLRAALRAGWSVDDTWIDTLSGSLAAAMG